MIGFTLSILTGVVWTLIGIVASKAAKTKENIISVNTINALFTLVWALIFIMKWKDLSISLVPRIEELSIIMCLVGIFNTAGFLFMMKGMSKGNSGITWSIGQSAMVVPFIASSIIWNNNIKANGWLGVILIFIMIILFGVFQGSDRKNKVISKWIILCFSTFLVIGLAQSLSTVPSRWVGWKDNFNLRLPITLLGGVVFQLPVFFIFKGKLTRIGFAYGFFQSILIIIGQKLLYLSMDSLSSIGHISVVYPIAIGTSIIGMAIYSFLTNEKLKLMQVIGIITGIVGIILISL